MRVEYTGPAQVAVVPELRARVARGEALEVDDALGARMLAQPRNWSAVVEQVAEPVVASTKPRRSRGTGRVMEAIEAPADGTPVTLASDADPEGGELLPPIDEEG